MNFGLGWNPDLEAQHAAALTALHQPLCALSAAIPDVIDPRSTIHCNNQGPFNSCEGNSRAKCLEYCNWVISGTWTKLSARFSYLTTKIVDGTLNGPDAGASIAGGVLASTKYGECTEERLPYWNWSAGEQYSNGIPPSATEMGLAHRLRSSTPLRSYDEGIAFLGGGVGAITFGITWTTDLRDCTGVITAVRGTALGGHAVAILGYIPRGGERWPLLYNSHSKSWGDNGTALVAPRLFDDWCRNSPYGVYGVSDLPVFTQRTFSWKGLVA